MAPKAAEPQVDDKVEDQNNDQPVITPPSGDNDDKVETPKVGKDTILPDDHPLIVKHSELKGKLANANTELSEARALSAKATKLEEELAARPTTEALETLQTRYDRLEEFVQAIPGLGKALDSRTFTRDLFETDKDIKDIVKDYQRANPTATSQALGGKAAQPADGKIDPNALIRAAFNGGQK
jgi:hypothetical protein